MDDFASESDLAACRIPPSGLCWWCGAVAGTREHKFKLSDLKRLSVDSSEPLIWGDGETQANVRSLRKSDKVKFSANLCANCNNSRSQKFDFAYEKFSDYVWQRQKSLWRARYIDMHQIYGANWGDEVLNLARYIVKHAGCRIANDGFPVPPAFSDFLNGANFLNNFHVCAFKNPLVYRAQRQISGVKCDPFGVWIGPMTGRVNRHKKTLAGFDSTLSIGFIGFAYRWYADVPDTDPFYLYRKARIHRLDRIPDF
ncbi:hypothetical protein [Streptomyces sp. NPDC047000]|uniref:hypothetical protein n=1 Tax=Streptomyces sp. NPDC047000 TaxID=3155474 RepID=UPI0033E0B922